MSKKLIYIGSEISIPGTAMNVHVLNRARLFSLIGYQVTFLSTQDERGVDSKFQIDHFQFKRTSKYCYLPKLGGVEDLWVELTGFRLYKLFLKEVKLQKPDMVVFYGYQAERQLIYYCQKHGIPLLIERVDWFEREDAGSVVRKYIYYPKKKRCVNSLDFRATGILSISEYMAAHYRSKGIPVFVLPPIFEADETKTICYKQKDAPLRLVYAGSLGNSKDVILPMIDAVIKINKESQRVLFDIVGITADAISEHFPENIWSEHGIIPHGRCSHDQALKVIRQADFSVLLRHNRRYAKAGFSTKFSESMFEGVPVICTEVGGCDIFVNHMHNGVKVHDNSTDTLLQLLDSLANLPPEKINAMKEEAFQTANRFFVLNQYKETINEFIENLGKKGNYNV